MERQQTLLSELDAGLGCLPTVLRNVIGRYVGSVFVCRIPALSKTGNSYTHVALGPNGLVYASSLTFTHAFRLVDNKLERVIREDPPLPGSVRGIAVTAQNALLVTRSVLPGVAKPRLAMVAMASRDGAGVLHEAPWGNNDNYVAMRVAVSPHDGTVFVTDLRGNVHKFDGAGNFLLKVRVSGTFDPHSRAFPLNLFGPPVECDVVVSPSNEVFVTDGRQHRVCVFDTDGEFVREFNSHEQVPRCLLMRPLAIAYTAGYVIVLDGQPDQHDAEGHAVQLLVFRASGAFLFLSHLPIADLMTHANYVSLLYRGSICIDRWGRVFLGLMDGGVACYSLPLQVDPAITCRACGVPHN